ncbi:AAA family ATPase [Vibrio hyugaensis]|uniref:AAA family ATPase n=1 Tax=Vibrio hyugaensis TaxID=1534743 RepID=UPI000CE56F2D|nr:chromosome partitioning protein ParA [Vibrio hyugaensis]
MFDLGKTLKETNTQQVIENTHGPAGCVLLYQSLECMSLVKEMFEFEGWNSPNCLKQSNIPQSFYSEQSGNIVILELNESDDIVRDAQHFATHLPTHKGIIVIGKEDSISTLRQLKEMGFYYLFWPINKHEFADFVMNVHRNLQTYSGVSKQRKAKRVAVVGSKGGIGTSLITTELSSKLSSQNIDTILVDHQYNDSNIDVLLAMEDFKSRAIDEFSVPIHELDTEGALSYLTKIRKNLRLLALQSERNQDDIFSYNQTLCELLSRNTNFIIEDFSGSVDFRVDPHWLIENYDVVVVVFEPSVSSVRNAKVLLEQLESKQVSMGKRIRTITLANHHRPENTFVIEQTDLKKYLGSEVNLDMPYCRSLSHLLLEGKRAHKHDRSINRTIEDLTRLINGQQTHHSTSWLSRLGAR